MLFVPLKTVLNALQSSYLMAWCCHICETTHHVTKLQLWKCYPQFCQPPWKAFIWTGYLQHSQKN